MALVFPGFYADVKLELGDIECSSKLPVSLSRNFIGVAGPVTRMWQMVHSFFAGVIRNRLPLPFRPTVVALVVNDQDRGVLANAFEQEPLDVRFAESCEEALSVVNQLTAPVVLLDRDWPGTDWKTAVQKLAASPHHACVILVSSVADVYLWQELIRWGGYDVLPKPLRPDKVERVVRLAISYWTSSPKPAVPAGSVGK